MPAKKCFATKEELEELYINQNLTIYEVADIYGMSASGMKKVLTNFGFKKDPKKYQENAKKTMLERYGTTASLNVPGAKEKMRQTSLEKYGYDDYIANYQGEVYSALPVYDYVDSTRRNIDSKVFEEALYMFS